MGFSFETSIPAFTVLLQGVLSFFSPCVLPLVPLYIGYLAGGTKTIDKDGRIFYKRSKVMINTLFFVIGVSFSFFLLGFGFSTLGRFFSGNRMLFARIGGIVVILFGLFQIGIFNPKLLNRERRLPFRMNLVAMNPFIALILGFTFSFAWTPCVGPALASVLLMATSANSSSNGFFLILVYTLGFVLPFLAVGLFTSSLLDFFKKHQRVVKYTVKIGGLLMIFMGIMMFTGWMNGITGYLSGLGNSNIAPNQTKESSSPSTPSPYTSSATPKPKKVFEAPDFTLVDQYGNTHTLSDYKGKTVFLNFWATWCDPCRIEMPDIQALYEKYNENKDELVVLGIANPKTPDSPNNSDVSQEEIEQFLTDNHYTYPVVMDLTGESFASYGISAFPTTFMIDKEGNLFGYLTGTLTSEIMEDIVKQTMEGNRK